MIMLVAISDLNGADTGGFPLLRPILYLNTWTFSRSKSGGRFLDGSTQKCNLIFFNRKSNHSGFLAVQYSDPSGRKRPVFIYGVSVIPISDIELFENIRARLVKWLSERLENKQYGSLSEELVKIQNLEFSSENVLRANSREYVLARGTRRFIVGAAAFLLWFGWQARKPESWVGAMLPSNQRVISQLETEFESGWNSEFGVDSHGISDSKDVTVVGQRSRIAKVIADLRRLASSSIQDCGEVRRDVTIQAQKLSNFSTTLERYKQEVQDCQSDIRNQLGDCLKRDEYRLVEAEMQHALCDLASSVEGLSAEIALLSNQRSGRPQTNDRPAAPERPRFGTRGSE